MANDERMMHYDEYDVAVADPEIEDEPGIKHISDYSTAEEIREALTHLDFPEAMGYDRETAEELRQMAGSTSYGAADIEERLTEDSPARALLANGYHTIFPEIPEGPPEATHPIIKQTMAEAYPMIEQAITDITQAMESMQFEDRQTQQEALTRYVDALMQREMKAIDDAITNWSSTGGDPKSIMGATIEWNSFAQRTGRSMLAAMLDMTDTQEARQQHENESENMGERTQLIVQEAELREFMARTQESWYTFNVAALANINAMNVADSPESVRQLMSDINLRDNQILPERDAAAYALEDAGIIDALDYLRDQAQHDLAESVMDGSVTTEKILDYVLNLDDMPKAMAETQFGGDTSALTGEQDRKPIYEAYFEKIKDEALANVEQAKATNDLQTMVEAINQIREQSAQMRLGILKPTLQT